MMVFTACLRNMYKYVCTMQHVAMLTLHCPTWMHVCNCQLPTVDADVGACLMYA